MPTTFGALADRNYIRSNNLQGNPLRVGNHLLAQLKARTEVLAAVGEVRGKGLMVGVELVKPGSLTPNPSAAQFVLEECRRGDVLIGKVDLCNNVLRIAPPMSATIDEVNDTNGVLTAALREVDRSVQGHQETARSRS